nr:amidohydrolase family protein [Mangrovicoccus ximenensis]
MLARARAAGTDISAETCLHYLLLDEDDLVRIGNVARCGPPLRPAPMLAALWGHVLAGGIDMVASDHCPYPPEDKAADLPVWQAGMGLTGVETNVPLLLSEGVLGRGMAPEQFARMTAEAPARRFGLWPRKGGIRVGADADLTLWDPSGEAVVSGAGFRGRARFSAFEGRKMRGRLVATLSRGEEVALQAVCDMAAASGGASEGCLARQATSSATSTPRDRAAPAAASRSSASSEYRAPMAGARAAESMSARRPTSDSICSKSILSNPSSAFSSKVSVPSCNAVSGLRRSWTRSLSSGLCRATAAASAASRPAWGGGGECVFT